MPTARLQRLDQLLASLGYGSRREVRDLVRAGRVTVDGSPVGRADQKVTPASVLFDNEPLEAPTGLFVILNKPAGYICSHEAREGPSVYELLPPRWLKRNPRIETIGRLDKDTTGVLLLTDDGQLNHRWTSPRHHVPKIYRVTVDKPLAPELSTELAKGDLLLNGEDKPCLPASMEIIEPTEARLTVFEGKYHQVKRMYSHFGYTVTRLHREQFGEFTLEDIPEGAYRLRNPSELLNSPSA